MCEIAHVHVRALAILYSFFRFLFLPADLVFPIVLFCFLLAPFTQRERAPGNYL